MNLPGYILDSQLTELTFALNADVRCFLPFNTYQATRELRDQPALTRMSCREVRYKLATELPFDTLKSAYFRGYSGLPVKVAVVANLASKRFRSVAPQCAWCGPDCSGSCTGAYNAGLC